MNIAYFIAKGMNKLGLSLNEVETMPFIKLRKLLEAIGAIEAEGYLEDLRIAANPKMLDTKNGLKSYPKIFKEYRKIAQEGSIKEIIIEADLSMLDGMIAQQLREAKK